MLLAPLFCILVKANNITSKRGTTPCSEVCKLKGHTKETCYKVVGYPPDYKFKKKTGIP